MRPLCLSIFLAFLAGCGGNWSNEDLVFLAALPDRAQLEAKLPGTTNAQQLEQSLGGRTSDIFLETRQTAQEFNEGLLGLLGGIEGLRRFPPTTREPTLRIWGPVRFWEGQRFDFRAVITRDDPDDPTEYVYSLELRPDGAAEDEWTAFIQGRFAPTASLQEGLGALRFDIAAARSLGFQSPDLLQLDAIQADYDTRGFPRVVHVALDPRPGSAFEGATWGYAEHENGAHALGFGVRLDLVPGPGIESLQVVSAWLARGAGRAHARVSGGDLAQPADHAECWGDDGVLLFERDWEGRVDGDPRDCALVDVPDVP